MPVGNALVSEPIVAKRNRLLRENDEYPDGSCLDYVLALDEQRRSAVVLSVSILLSRSSSSVPVVEGTHYVETLVRLWASR